MTDEELDNLMQEVSGQIAQLTGDPEKPLDRAERKRKYVLQSRRSALDSIKEAREKGNVNQESKACIDYALWTEYGERHWLLFNLMKSQTWWRGF